MITFLVMCLISILTVTGAYAILYDVYRKLYKKIPERIIVHSRDFENEIEYSIRSLCTYYPETQIIVICDSTGDEFLKTLNMLAGQYKNLFLR